MAISLTCPKQNTPLSEDSQSGSPSEENQNLFRLTWYNFLYNLASAVRTLIVEVGDILSSENALSGVTGGLTLTTSYQAIPSSSYTLAKAGTWLVIASVRAGVNTQGVDLTVQLWKDGVAEAGDLYLDINTGTNTDSIIAGISRPWVVVSDGTTVVELQAKVGSTTGSGGGTISGTHSIVVAEFLHP